MKLCECNCGTEIPELRADGKPRRYIKGHQFAKPPRILVDPERLCWLWMGAKTAAGYGVMYDRKRQRQDGAHRLYYERGKGPIPDGFEIDHLCRVKACVNPDHLEATTHPVNAQRRRTTKLTEPQVLEIRDLCAQGWLQQDIADAYGVHKNTVSSIRRRQNWKSI